MFGYLRHNSSVRGITPFLEPMSSPGKVVVLSSSQYQKLYNFWAALMGARYDAGVKEEAAKGVPVPSRDQYIDELLKGYIRPADYAKLTATQKKNGGWVVSMMIEGAQKQLGLPETGDWSSSFGRKIVSEAGKSVPPPARGRYTTTIKFTSEGAQSTSSFTPAPAQAPVPSSSVWTEQKTLWDAPAPAAPEFVPSSPEVVAAAEAGAPLPAEPVIPKWALPVGVAAAAYFLFFRGK